MGRSAQAAGSDRSCVAASRLARSPHPYHVAVRERENPSESSASPKGTATLGVIVFGDVLVRNVFADRPAPSKGGKTMTSRQGPRQRAVIRSPMVIGLGLGAIGWGVSGLAQEIPGKPPAAHAIAPVAPVIPAEVVAALQEKRYGEAATALTRIRAELQSKDPADAAYAALVLGIAQRLDGKLDDARSTLRAALQEGAKTVWAAKL